MNDSKSTPDDVRRQTMLFAQLVEILTQNAILMLGAVPDRQGRQRPPDLNGAEMMIDILGVLQKRTKGNLAKEEEKMLTGTIYQLQAAFAEIASKTGEFGKARKATEAAETAEEDIFDNEMDPSVPPQQTARPSGAQPSPQKPQGIQAAVSQTAESKIKFTKKYG